MKKYRRASSPGIQTGAAAGRVPRLRELNGSPPPRSLYLAVWRSPADRAGVSGGDTSSTFRGVSLIIWSALAWTR